MKSHRPQMERTSRPVVEGIKRAIRAVVPPSVLDPIIQRLLRNRWEGDYESWAAAARRTRGYDEGSILDRVVASTRLVRDGVATFERDGVAFCEAAVQPHLLAGLQAAVRDGCELSVLDFGGSLGSLYWQLRGWLETQEKVRWSVVEQAHYVRAGSSEFADGRLRFFASIEECLERECPDVLLLAGVLPYLAEPHALLESVADRGFAHILIDRTGVIDRSTDRLTVQHVPRRIHKASYPCWFFNRERLLGHFACSYDLLREYTNDDGAGSGFGFKGFHLRRRHV